MPISTYDDLDWNGGRPGCESADDEDELLPDLTWGVRNERAGMVELQDALLDPMPCLCDWPCDCWERF